MIILIQKITANVYAALVMVAEFVFHAAGAAENDATPTSTPSTNEPFRLIRDAGASRMERMMAKTIRHLVLALVTVFALGSAAAEGADVPKEGPISIAEVKRDAPVTFHQDILPILKKKCLACHNKSDDNGGLILEMTADLIKGGDSGPAIKPGDSGQSLLLQMAAWQEKPFMPPPDNDREAKPLTPEELGLVKLWIDTGARAGKVVPLVINNRWNRLPATVANRSYAVAITADGQYVASAWGNRIAIHHLPTERQIGYLFDPDVVKMGIYGNKPVAHLDFVRRMVMDRSDTLLATGSFRTVKLWRRPHGVQKYKLPPTGGAITAIATSSNGRYVAIGDQKGTVTLAKAATGRGAIKLTGHAAEITRLRFSPDHKQLLSGSADGVVRFWSLPGGDFLGQLTTGAPVKDFAVTRTRPYIDTSRITDEQQKQKSEKNNRESRVIVTVSGDDKLRVWNSLQPPRPSIDVPKGQKVFAFSPNRGAVAVSAGDGKIHIIDLIKGTVAHTLEGHEGAVRSLSFSGNNSHLASAGADGKLIVWNLSKGQPDATITAPAPQTAVALIGNGQQLISGGADGKLLLYKMLKPPSADAALEPQVLEGHTGTITRLLWLNNIISASQDGTVRAFNPADGKQVFSATHGAAVADVAILYVSGKPSRLASAGADKQIKLWDAASGAAAGQLGGFAGPVAAVMFLPSNVPDIKQAAVLGSTATAPQVLVFREGKLQEKLAPPAGAALALTARGELNGTVQVTIEWLYMATADHGVQVAQLLSPVATIEAGFAGVSFIDALPVNGRQPRVVYAAADGTIHAADLQQKKLYGNQKKHGAAITVLGPGPMTTGADGTVKMWSLTNKNPPRTFSGDDRVKAKVPLLTLRVEGFKEQIEIRKRAVSGAEKQRKKITETVKKKEEAIPPLQKKFDEAKAALGTAKKEKEAAEKEEAAATTARDAAMKKFDALVAARAKEQDAAKKQELAKQIKEADKASKEAVTKFNQAKGKANAARKKASGAGNTLKSAEAPLRLAQRHLEQMKNDIKKGDENIKTAKAKQAASEAALKVAEAAVEAGKKAIDATVKPLRAVAISPDGKHLAYAEVQGKIHIIDMKSRKGLEVIEGHKGPVRAVEFVDNETLLSVAADGVIAWDLFAPWKLERTIGSVDDPKKLEGSVHAIAFSPDGKLMATGSGTPSRSGQLKIWNVANGSLVREFEAPHGDMIYDVDFSPDGKLLATASGDHFCKEFEVATGKMVKSKETSQHMMVVSYRWDGEDKITGGGKTVAGRFTRYSSLRGMIGGTSVGCAEWNIKNGRMQNSVTLTGSKGAGQMTALAISADTTIWVACDLTGVVRIWRVTRRPPAQPQGFNTPQLLRTIKPPPPELASPAVASAGGE